MFSGSFFLTFSVFLCGFWRFLVVSEHLSIVFGSFWLLFIRFFPCSF